MRIRTIKPEFWESESLGRVSREARLLFIGLFSCCDDSGRTRAASRLLASRLFPYDLDAINKIDGWLQELSTEGCIRVYRVDGETYLDIPKWLSHQKIDRPSESKLPKFDESSRVLAKCSLGTGNREQGTGTPLTPPQGGMGGVDPAEEKALTRTKRLAKARPILFYLNEKTGRRYSDTENNLSIIAARMDEVDWDQSGAFRMIDRQVERWNGTPQEEYLRPTTLFNKTKFDGYWAARDLPVANGDHKPKLSIDDRILQKVRNLKCPV